MIDWIQSHIVGFVVLLVMLFDFGLATLAGVAAGRTNNVFGWIVGIGMLIVLVLLTNPITETLNRTACGLNIDYCD